MGEDYYLLRHQSCEHVNFFFGKYSKTKTRYLNITNPFSEEVKLQRFEFQDRKANTGF